MYTPGHGVLLASTVVTTVRPSLKAQIQEPVAYNPDPGCPMCRVVLDPGSIVTNPAVGNPAVNVGVQH
jgi:hypothetical protein